MFDLSLAEVALIVVVAVLFIGPNELPVVIRAAGKAIRAVRGFARELKQLFDEIARESGLDDVAKEVHRDVVMIKGDDGKMYESFPHMMPLPPKKPEEPRQ